MRGEQLGDLLVAIADRAVERPELDDQVADHQPRMFEHGFIGGERERGVNHRDPRAQQLRGRRIVGHSPPLGQPPFELFGGGPLQFALGRKFLQQGQRRFARQVQAAEFESQQIALFQALLQFIGRGHSVLDPLAALLGQQSQAARDRIVRTPRAQFVGVVAEKAGQQFGIGRIALRAAGVQGRAIVRELLRVEGMQYEELILHQRVDQGTARLLQTDRDRPSAELLAQLGGPRGDRFRSLLDSALLGHTSRGRQNTNRMRFMLPIDADERGKFNSWRHHKCLSKWRERNQPPHAGPGPAKPL